MNASTAPSRAAEIERYIAGVSAALADPGPSYPPSGSVGYGEPTEVYVYTEGGRSITNVRVYNRRGEAVPIGVPMGCEQSEPVYREQRDCIPETDSSGPPEPSGTTTQSGSVASSPSAS